MLWDKEFRLGRLFPFLGRLPRAIGYRLATRLGMADARFRRGAMAQELTAVDAGMARLLPELAADPQRRAQAVAAYGALMARDKVDCFYMPRFEHEGCGNLIRLAGAEHLAAARDMGRGVILVISHFGRFFMLGPGLGLNGFPFAMLTTMVDERNRGYDAVELAYMKAKMANTLRYSQGEWVTTADDFRRVFRLLRDGRILLMAMDGLETNSDQKLQVPFFGGTLQLPAGIVRIAERSGAKLVYAAVRDVAHDCGVTIGIHPLPDDPAQALAESVTILERDVRATPWHWWQWPLLPMMWRADPPPT